jgi:mannan endo-1,4-beta-mannosidase
VQAPTGTQSTGDLTEATTYTLTCTGSGGSASQTATISVTAKASTEGRVSRPGYNTGDGLFVADGELYDSNGAEFRIRGLNRHDLSVMAQPGMSNTNANTIRIDSADGLNASGFSSEAAAEISRSQVPVVSAGWTTGGAGTAGSTDDAVLTNVVNWWVSNFSSFSSASLQKHMILNIASEWGPANSSAWATDYEAAIATLRAAGYTCPIMIDAGDYGQDINDLLNYSTAVFNSDPQKNIIFALHMYSTAASDNLAPLASLAHSVGMVFVVGEFGPASQPPYNPTATPQQIISNAESNGIGWMPWAWDESGDVFQMTTNIGVYRGTAYNSTDLTAWGQIIVPYLQSLAVKATDFP